MTPMLSGQQWWLFMGVLVVSYLSPGPDAMMIIRASRHGRATGFAAAAGALTGLAVYAVLSTAGLATLISARPESIEILSLLGAGYLTYLGLRTIAAIRAVPRELPHDGHEGADTHSPRHRGGIFAATLLTNLTNPKVLLFFIAVLPQFVDDRAPLPPARQLAILGAADVAAGLVLLPIIVVCAAKLVGNLGPRGAWRFEIGVGCLLTAFGLILAVETITR
ncbi:LysE family translocator [Nocardia sp. CA2R105]|uniref:LysE family translocator n=1 Tax=Nocardia coffeae TaxID=2873381 RepID=UPI001CA73BB1|nr:LysE family translocator [Nocardia coffeae]MBY8863793.1 LysE family translocator [Nocardia coffeae]